MENSMIPHVSQPIADNGGTITAPWQRFLDALNEALTAGKISTAGFAEAVSTIASALGSPDGTVENIPEALPRLLSTDQLPEGVSSLFFTNERAQDAVGGMVVDSASIDFTYDDATPSLTGVVKPSGVAAGSYGNATNVSTFTAGADGRLTLAGQTAIAFPADAVSSVFGRTGAVVAVANDYTFAQIGSKPTTLAGYGITDGYTDANARAAVVIDSIADADVDHAPSRNAVFDALALKTANASAAITGGTINGATIGATTPAACTFTTLTAGSPGIGRYFNVSATGAQLIRIDDNARTTPLTFANYGITALNQGFQVDFTMGAGGALGATAAELHIVSTDTWAAAANRSSELKLYLSQAGSLGLAISCTRAAIKPGADNTISCGTSTLRLSETYSTNLRPGAGTVIWTSGTGTPEAVVTAPVGSLFTRTDGGAGTTLYVKESGASNTGWVAK